MNVKPSQNNRLGVGIVGCGAISRMHIEAYERNPFTEIRAVSSGTEKSARAVGERLGVPFYTDYRAMIDRGDIDLISVCTPSGLHMEPVLYGAERGVHAVVEKPLEITAARIDRMRAACEENGVLLSCIFNNRFTDAHRFLKRAMEAGRFGRLTNANMSVRWYRKPAYYTGSKWHGTLALDGGGALMNQSIHYIDLLLWLVGDVKSVCGYTGTLLHTSIEAEDTAVACLQFENGALGTILGTTSTYPGYPAELQIAGTRGSAVVTDGAITAWRFLDDDPLDEEAARLMAQGGEKNDRAADPMAFAAVNHCRQIDGIIDALRRGTSPEVDAAQARRSVALIEAIYRSASEGTPVVL